MSCLFERMMEPCVMRVRTSAADGEGGRTNTWTDGESFKAALIKENDAPDKISEKRTETVTYKVTADVKLNFNSIFKRVSDGVSFRVTSECVTPPSEAGFAFYQCSAERWAET